MQKRQDIDLDIRKLMNVLGKRFYLILLCALLFGGLTAAAESFFVPPVYQSTTKLYVQTRQNEAGLLSSDMQTSTMLAKDYAELIQCRDVTEQVIQELGLHMSHEELLSRMTVSVPSDTRIIEISVKDTDPEEAQKIVEAVRDTAAVHIRAVTSAEAVNTAEQANLPEKPVSPKIKRDAAAAGLFGSIAAVFVLVILVLRDDRLYTAQDIEDVLEISILGTIPLDEKKAYGHRRRQE